MEMVRAKDGEYPPGAGWYITRFLAGPKAHHGGVARMAVGWELQ
jgi:hypothetical protein